MKLVARDRNMPPIILYVDSDFIHLGHTGRHRGVVPRRMSLLPYSRTSRHLLPQLLSTNFKKPYIMCILSMSSTPIKPIGTLV